jgi:hypothetical protein
MGDDNLFVVIAGSDSEKRNQSAANTKTPTIVHSCKVLVLDKP